MCAQDTRIKGRRDLQRNILRLRISHKDMRIFFFDKFDELFAVLWQSINQWAQVIGTWIRLMHRPAYQGNSTDPNSIGDALSLLGITCYSTQQLSPCLRLFHTYNLPGVKMASTKSCHEHNPPLATRLTFLLCDSFYGSRLIYPKE